MNVIQAFWAICNLCMNVMWCLTERWFKLLNFQSIITNQFQSDIEILQISIKFILTHLNQISDMNVWPKVDLNYSVFNQVVSINIQSDIQNPSNFSNFFIHFLIQNFRCKCLCLKDSIFNQVGEINIFYQIIEILQIFSQIS